MRCYMGTRDNRRTQLPLEAHIENTVKVLRAVRSQAVDAGVRIGVENHAGDMQAREVKGLIEAAGKDFVGSCLDTGNPMWVAEDPAAVARNPGALRRDIPHPGQRRLRPSPRRGGPVGGTRRWLGGFRAFRPAIPQAMPGRRHATRGDHRPPSRGAAVSGAGLLESVPENTCLGIRALRGAGARRPSFSGQHGDRTVVR